MEIFVSSRKFFYMVLFISSGEIAIIMFFILIFFGADKIPEFAKIMGKGVREVKKATDDIKREFQESSSGLMDDIKSISDDLTDTLTKEISDPVQKTINETTKTFDEYEEEYNVDYYYDNQDDIGDYGNEFHAELPENTIESSEQDTTIPTELNTETQS